MLAAHMQRAGPFSSAREGMRGTVVTMTVEREVLAAARSRAAALAAADAAGLTALLHEDFRWTSHVGETYDRAEYVRRNTAGQTAWGSQTLVDPEVVVVGGTAVLYAKVQDVVRSHGGAAETFRMPMTQVWVRSPGGWRCLAGHAGPLLP